MKTNKYIEEEIVEEELRSILIKMVKIFIYSFFVASMMAIVSFGIWLIFIDQNSYGITIIKETATFTTIFIWVLNVGPMYILDKKHKTEFLFAGVFLLIIDAIILICV